MYKNHRWLRYLDSNELSVFCCLQNDQLRPYRVPGPVPAELCCPVVELSDLETADLLWARNALPRFPTLASWPFRQGNRFPFKNPISVKKKITIGTITRFCQHGIAEARGLSGVRWSHVGRDDEERARSGAREKASLPRSELYHDAFDSKSHILLFLIVCNFCIQANAVKTRAEIPPQEERTSPRRCCRGFGRWQSRKSQIWLRAFSPLWTRWFKAER